MIYQRNPHPTPREWLEEKIFLGMSRNDVLLLVLIGVMVAIAMSMDWDKICGLR